MSVALLVSVAGLTLFVIGCFAMMFEVAYNTRPIEWTTPVFFAGSALITGGGIAALVLLML